MLYELLKRTYRGHAGSGPSSSSGICVEALPPGFPKVSSGCPRLL
jgi:hypothetical protein